MSNRLVLIPVADLPVDAERLFGERLIPHPDDVDGVQPYDAREAKVLPEAVAWNLVPDYSAQSWWTLHEALPYPTVPRGEDGWTIDSRLWIAFRAWAGWVKGHPVSELDQLPEFDPGIYAPSGEPWPVGTVFYRDGRANVPAGVVASAPGDLTIPAAIADSPIIWNDEGLTIREVVARLEDEHEPNPGT